MTIVRNTASRLPYYSLAISLLLLTIPQILVADMITTIAGDGTRGLGSGGREAVKVQMNSPTSIAISQNGTFYIADTGNHQIRQVGLDGKMITIAGDGTQGYYGHGVLAVTAQLNSPAGIALDSAGHLYIADTGNHVIRKIDVGGYITTIAGNGMRGYQGDGGIATAALLNTPMGIAVDSAGNLYIADTGNHLVRKLEKVSGHISTLSDKNQTDLSNNTQ